jgi:predicted NAD/FAD-binding protein
MGAAMASGSRLRIGVVGTGVAGLSAAWLLSRRHDVVVYEKADRIGGHSNTVLARVDGSQIPVDVGFIVYNPKTYPNFVELLNALGVKTQPSDMSFAVSLDHARIEYAGASLISLFGQPSNIVSPRFWGMLADLARFYSRAPRDHHILPMASAIWSATPAEIMAFPAAAFIRFHDNHGLLRLTGRPIWRTVSGGATEYVGRMGLSLAGAIRYGTGAVRIERDCSGATVIDGRGGRDRFDHVVLACHADEALALVGEPSEEERALLGAFRYSRNLAILHTDESLMPRRRAVWASWNYIGGEARAPERVCVTYWMNRLQSLPTKTNVFVTLNPSRPPREESVLETIAYDHPLFDARAIAAQKALWRLQGVRNVWYCGAHFGSGFHEDALQAGLAVAEELGGVKRPWTVAGESSRIWVTPRAAPAAALERAA